MPPSRGIWSCANIMGLRYMCEKCKDGEICIDGLLDGSVGLADGVPSKGCTITWTGVGAAPDWIASIVKNGGDSGGDEETRILQMDENGVRREVFELRDAARVFLVNATPIVPFIACLIR